MKVKKDFFKAVIFLVLISFIWQLSGVVWAEELSASTNGQGVAKVNPGQPGANISNQDSVKISNYLKFKDQAEARNNNVAKFLKQLQSWRDQTSQKEPLDLVAWPELKKSLIDDKDLIGDDLTAMSAAAAKIVLWQKETKKFKDDLSKLDSLLVQYQKVQNQKNQSALLKYLDQFLVQPEVKLTNKQPFQVDPAEKINLQTIAQAAAATAQPVLISTSSSAITPSSTNSILELDEFTNPTAADLTSTSEIILSQKIAGLATQLNHEPVKIFNYVHNYVDFVPYFGSKKGAEVTLLEEQGNDVDISSLFQALLRSSNIPTRYVKLTTRLYPDQLNSIFGTQNPWNALQEIANAGLPHEAFEDQNNNLLYADVEHIATAVYLPYSNYRGAGLDQTGSRWLVLDPSWHEESIAQILDAPELMNFNVTQFLENYIYHQQSSTPLELYRQTVDDFIQASSTLRENDSEQGGYNYDNTLTFKSSDWSYAQILPDSLPYEVVSSMTDLSSWYSDRRQQLRIQVTSTSQTLLDFTGYYPQLAHQQILLDYEGATAADQQIILQYGNLFNTPPSLVNVRPILRVNGQTVASGSSVSMAQSVNLSLSFIEPRLVNGSITSQVRVQTTKDTITGNYEAIAFNLGHLYEDENIDGLPNSSEYGSGQKLYLTAWNFLKQIELSQKELSRAFNAVILNEGTRAVVSNGVSVSYLNGVPQNFVWRGLRIDSSSDIKYQSRVGEVNRNQPRFMTLAGLDGSWWESKIFEQDFNVPSIGTIKGLIINATDPLRGIVKIDQSNSSTIETLQVSAATKAVFRQAVAQGHVIYTPSSAFNYLDNWQGLVYLNLDPVTGNGGYIIGENLNGGYTAGVMLASWNSLFQRVWNIVQNFFVSLLSPTPNSHIERGQTLNISGQYGIQGLTALTLWPYNSSVYTGSWPLGLNYINANFGSASVSVPVIIDAPGYVPNNPTSSINIDNRWAEDFNENFSTNRGSSFETRDVSNINKIVLHYTIGWNAEGTKVFWLNENGQNATTAAQGIGANYLIDRDGVIYRAYSDDVVSQHAGPRGNPNSIGIEIVNIGYLNGQNSQYTTSFGSTYNVGQVQNGYMRSATSTDWPDPADVSVRNCQDPNIVKHYWEPYTEQQYLSLNSLIGYLINRYSLITRHRYGLNPLSYEPNASSTTNFHGIMGHTTVKACGKWDPGPALDWNRFSIN